MDPDSIKTIELTFVNAYLIKVKESFILIDTGFPMHWEKLEQELLSEGCLPNKFTLVILTHGDFDHSGNCARLQEKYHCKVAVHKDESYMVENGLILNRKIRTIRSKIFFWIRKLFRKKFSPIKFKPDILLIDGQDLNEYELDAKVVHIPGHTKGSIGVLTSDGAFFAGDTFTNTKKPDTAIIIENQQELNDSLARIKDMNIKTVYPGHGKPFDFSAIVDKI